MGYDRFSFSYQAKNGQVFHSARGRPYGEPFGAGDIVGCLFYGTNDLEERQVEYVKEAPVWSKKDPRWAKPVPIFSKKEERDTNHDIMRGSFIRFYKNGQPVADSPAFEDIPAGNYYAAVSLFMGGRCSLNFGPNFSSLPVLSDKEKGLRPIRPLSSVVPSEHPVDQSVDSIALALPPTDAMEGAVHDSDTKEVGPEPENSNSVAVSE